MDRNIKLGRDGLFTYLRLNNLLIKQKKNYTKTTHSKHWMRKYPNLLKEYKATKAEEVFVSDITYLKSDEGTHYLSLTTDVYSRKIMDYQLSDEMKASDVVKALNMCISNKRYAHNAIHHSYRDLQHCSDEYQQLVNTVSSHPLQMGMIATRMR